jgi:hypothetical protein
LSAANVGRCDNKINAAIANNPNARCTGDFIFIALPNIFLGAGVMRVSADLAQSAPRRNTRARQGSYHGMLLAFNGSPVIKKYQENY